MTEWNEQEAAALVRLQRGIPLSERPFEELGQGCGMTEAAVLELVRRLLASGDARRFGAVFDARRLGYRSALCCMRVPRPGLAQAAAQVARLRGVTHAYERGWPAELPPDSPGGPAGRDWPNLWFTLAAPAETFAQELDGLRAACRPLEIAELPALRRFKIDVVFDVRTRDRDERVEPRPVAAQPDSGVVYRLDEVRQAWVRRLQGDLPAVPRFFAPLADELGVGEGALLSQLREWQSTGVMRRIGLLLRHREIGFKANGMCCWDVAPEQVMACGRRVAAFPEVTHCYERPWTEPFPFRLYGMIHTPTWEGTQALFMRISREACLTGGQLLLSLAEFKKTSMQFF
jgi:DNA-binding Lrp family transcriptional regulator